MATTTTTTTTTATAVASADTWSRTTTHCDDCSRAIVGDYLPRCSRCKQVHYCNAQCQHRSWPRHRAVCAPHGYEVFFPIASGDGPDKRSNASVWPDQFLEAIESQRKDYPERKAEFERVLARWRASQNPSYDDIVKKAFQYSVQNHLNDNVMIILSSLPELRTKANILDYVVETYVQTYLQTRTAENVVANKSRLAQDLARIIAPQARFGEVSFDPRLFMFAIIKYSDEPVVLSRVMRAVYKDEEPTDVQIRELLKEAQAKKRKDLIMWLTRVIKEGIDPRFLEG